MRRSDAAKLIARIGIGLILVVLLHDAIMASDPHTAGVHAATASESHKTEHHAGHSAFLSAVESIYPEGCETGWPIVTPPTQPGPAHGPICPPTNPPGNSDLPYGALVATFHTGLGCLMGPSVLFLATKALVG